MTAELAVCIRRIRSPVALQENLGPVVLSGDDVRRLQEQPPDGTLIVDLSSHLEGTIDAHL